MKSQSLTLINAKTHLPPAYFFELQRIVKGALIGHC